jgi:diacylglycerol kinase
MEGIKITENVLTAPGMPAGKKVGVESWPGFNKSTKPHRFVGSLGFAWQGILYFVRHERNGRIQFCAAVLAIAAGIFFKISLPEWIWVGACIGSVLSLEMINTALEELCNVVSTDFHPRSKSSKTQRAPLLSQLQSVLSLVA